MISVLAILSNSTFCLTPYKSTIYNTHEFKTYNFDLMPGGVYSYIINRGTKYAIYKHLMINFSKNITENEFNNAIEFATIKLSTNEFVLCENKLSLYTKLEAPLIKNNSVLISLPYEYFFDKLYLFCIQFTNINLEIRFNKPVEINEITTMVKHTHIYEPLRHHYHAFVKISQNIESKYFNTDDLILDVNVNYISGVCRGFFIETDVTKLNRMQIIVDKYIYADYDSLVLSKYCKNINNKLLYVPNDLKTTDYTAYNDLYDVITHNCFNLSQIRSFHIKLYFDKPVLDCGIHGLSINYLGYKNGHIQKIERTDVYEWVDESCI